MGENKVLLVQETFPHNLARVGVMLDKTDIEFVSAVAQRLCADAISVRQMVVTQPFFAVTAMRS